MNKDKDNDIKLSKTLSYLLRHGAHKENLKIDSNGFISINVLLKHPKLRQITLEKIEEIVSKDSKQRFYLKKTNTDLLIRANQGHSLDVDVEMKQIINSSEIPTLIHGTTLKAWHTIKNEGLNKMNRKHVHLAVGLLGENGVFSGMRNSCEVYIYIDSEKAIQEGIIFYRSLNNVILTESTLLPRVFSKVTNFNGFLI